jgi:hypothetical protein
MLYQPLYTNTFAPAPNDQAALTIAPRSRSPMANDRDSASGDSDDAKWPRLRCYVRYFEAGQVCLLILSQPLYTNAFDSFESLVSLHQHHISTYIIALPRRLCKSFIILFPTLYLCLVTRARKGKSFTYISSDSCFTPVLLTQTPAPSPAAHPTTPTCTRQCPCQHHPHLLRHVPAPRKRMPNPHQRQMPTRTSAHANTLPLPSPRTTLTTLILRYTFIYVYIFVT